MAVVELDEFAAAPDAAVTQAAQPSQYLPTTMPQRRLYDMDDDAFSPSSVEPIGTICSGNFVATRVDLDTCVESTTAKSDAKHFPKTLVDLDESVVGTEDHDSNATVPETSRSLPKTALATPKGQQETVRPASKSYRCIFIGVVVVVLLACTAAIIWRGHWGRHESNATSNTQTEDYCQICPMGFELSTPDAKFDLPTSASMVKGMTCAEVLENARKGEYDIGLFCPLIQAEAAGICVCRESSKAVNGQPTTPVPTASPTSAGPSSSPTMEDLYVPPNPVPTNRARSYFNYDLNDNRFGPNGWSKIDMSGTYYAEFGENGYGVWKNHLIDHVSDSTKNRCYHTGKQSPVDVIKTTGVGADCTAAHQIRPRPGSFPLMDERIEKLIEPNSLRLKLNRRSCLDLTNDNCTRDRPPLADFPNYSSTVSQNSDLLYLDVKVPGEHRVRGEAFDAEIQMMHIHLDASRIAYLGIPIRATADGYNENFQHLLDQFQLVYDRHKAECAAAQQPQQRRRRGLRTPLDFLKSNKNLDQPQSLYSDDPEFQRRLQFSSKFPFDPYAAFMEWLYFYRYNGSSTDPPCFPVTWFVIERPIHINFQQLKQTKYLLFTHTNGNCEKTSVHNEEQSVTRPIQPLGIVYGTNEKREVMSCMEGEFDPDEAPAQ